jgi:hypothetical protein
MYRARTVLNNLVPLAPLIPRVAPQRFASWLNSTKTKVVLSNPPRRWYNAPVAAEPFLNGSSSSYVEEMYNSWLADPKSVHAVSFLKLYVLGFVCIKSTLKLLKIGQCLLDLGGGGGGVNVNAYHVENHNLFSDKS